MLKHLSQLDATMNRLGIGMRGKLILLFVAIKVAPLVLLATMAWTQFESLGEKLRERTEILAAKAVHDLTVTGDMAVTDAIEALDNMAREDIERMTTETARQVAAFLYARDADIRLAAALSPDAGLYQTFVDNKLGRLVRQGLWELSPDGKRWQPANPAAEAPSVVSSNAENELNFHYRAPDALSYDVRPLFLEMAFIGLDGKEQVKVVTSDRFSKELKDVSRRENTYARAETFFEEVQRLKPGEIYVSEVIGTYVPSKLIGMFTPANADKVGIPFEPEKWAFSGKENPVGQRFKGIVRWATPVERNGAVIGYVTLALDHDHLMAFVDHITPTRQRTTELSDAFEGNYAFIWDYKGRSIVHPRHHSIVGYHPQTGDPQTPWLEDRIYDRWQASGQSYPDFIVNEPTFVEQSTKKKSAPALTAQGLVGLDCRYLNFAPQCTGWFDLTSKGGSGSFNILWSGLRKLTTAATIPYFTGRYADSPRGFGFVAVGAGLEDFHRPATETGKELARLVADADAELKEVVEGTKTIIRDNLTSTGAGLVISTTLMILLVVLIAVWMASAFTGRIKGIINGISRFRRGERQFRFNAEIKDEMGVLCDSFDSMADSIENSVQGTLVITDTQTRIIYGNKTFLSAVGKTLDEVIGKEYAAISIYGQNNPLKALFSGTEAKVIFHEGAGCHFKGLAEEYRNENGQLMGYIIVCTDVTSMVEVQRKTEEQRLLLNTMVSSSPDYVWYKNAQNRYVAANPLFAAACGCSPEDMVGKAAADFFDLQIARHIDRQDELLKTRHEPLRLEEEIYHVGKQQSFVVEAVRTPIFNADGTFAGILGVARDITERTRIANALRKTQRELEHAVETANQANAAKGQFLANMSHEIRTPMNAILGFAYIALHDNPPPAQRDLFQKIHMAATGLLTVINDILDFSKIEARKLELDMTAFSLYDHLCSVLDMMHFKAEEKGIQLCPHFSAGVPCLTPLLGDATRLRQVLVNLIGNAIKFTVKGGVVFEVEEDDRTTSHVTLRFTVYDTGIGIAPDVLGNLFKPFAQADGSITRRFGGTGLGLVISRELVELMGGHLVVSSEPGFGSQFTFSLAFPLRAEAKRFEAVEKRVGPADISELKGKSVLVVEDNDINQMIASSLLEQAEMVVSIASNGVEAVEKIKATDFDLVLMDIQMPVMDGLEATRRIRACESVRPGLPIVAMTAHAMSDDHAKSLEAGMNAHITKPIDPDTLYQTLLYWIFPDAR